MGNGLAFSCIPIDCPNRADGCMSDSFNIDTVISESRYLMICNDCGAFFACTFDFDNFRAFTSEGE